jgi:uncharacterized protein (DUF433 family)
MLFLRKIKINYDMQLQDIILIDPDTLGGTPVFKGSRVPIWLNDNKLLGY